MPRKMKTPAKTTALLLRRAANILAKGGVSPKDCLTVANSVSSVVDWLRRSAKLGGTPEVA